MWRQTTCPLALEKYEIKMKTKQRENNFRSRVRDLSRPRTPGHDPLLVFNMSIFNFIDGWSRTFSKYEYTRFGA